MPLKPVEVIALSPAAIKAGEELAQAAEAVYEALSVGGPKGRGITKSEAKRIGRESGDALKAVGKLLIELAVARRS